MSRPPQGDLQNEVEVGEVRNCQSAERDSPRLPLLLAAILTVVITLTFLLLSERLPTIEDTIGYTYAAELLVSGEGLGREDVHNAKVGPYFSMYAFQIRRDASDALYFGFPPGFPLVLALGAAIRHPYLIVPLLAGIGLLGTFFLAKQSSNDDTVALWATVLLALTPAYWTFGTAAWSEVPSVAFITVGLSFYLLSRGRSHAGWPSILFTLLALALLIYSLFIRYANLFAILPGVAFYELLSGREKVLREKWRWLFYLGLCFGLLAIPLFNHVYYGGALTTNYSPAHGWYPHSPFSLAYALGPSFVNGYSFRAVLSTLWQNYAILLLLLPIGWFVSDRASAALHASGILATAVLYSFYAFAAEGINSRFLLPVFPFIAVSIATALVYLGRRLPGTRSRWSAALLLLALLLLPMSGIVNELQARNAADLQFVQRIQKMTAATEPDAVFLSYVYNDQIAYYGQRSILNYRRIPPSDAAAERYHWELLEPCLKQMVWQLVQNGTPVYYVEDKSPPYANSLAILQSQFQMEAVQQDPTVYRVKGAREQSTIEITQTCPLLVGS